jgi:hypothetical protein
VSLRSLTLRELTIDDEPAFRHVGLYHQLKQVLLDDDFRFRVPPPGSAGAYWGRVLFLNLTFWNASEPSDVLASELIPADVVTHAAWHHLARRALARPGEAASADALFLGEAIASAFDLYLVGRLLGHAPDSAFLQTQVPAMADAAADAGLAAEEFEALLQSLADEPERGFEELRALLFDATTALLACDSVDRAAAVLEGFAERRFAPLLHHYELSNWILYARAYAAPRLGPDPHVRAVDAALRAAPVSLDWLEREWLGGAR